MILGVFKPLKVFIVNSVARAVLVAGLLSSAYLWAQQPMPTADQLLDKYVEAVGGAEKFAAISTWYEKWDVIGDLTDFVPRGRAPTQFKSHGQGESYFKAPTFRVTWVRSDRNDFVEGSGCDGKESWAYSPRRGVEKHKPTADHEYACEQGMNPFPMGFHREKAKLELKGQKKVAGQTTLVIHAEVPDQVNWDLYVDSQNYLLLRLDLRGRFNRPTSLYSDYRDVEGFKVPFHIEVHTDNTDYVMKLQEVRVNMPIDDGVFRRPN